MGDSVGSWSRPTSRLEILVLYAQREIVFPLWKAMNRFVSATSTALPNQRNIGHVPGEELSLFVRDFADQ